MTQKRLNHLLLLHNHRPQTDVLDVLGVAKECISRNVVEKNSLVIVVNILPVFCIPANRTGIPCTVQGFSVHAYSDVLNFYRDF